MLAMDSSGTHSPATKINNLTGTSPSQDEQSIRPEQPSSPAPVGPPLAAGHVSSQHQAALFVDDGPREQMEQEKQESIDLEALERKPSGPPYSSFTTAQKWYIVFLTAFGGFFSPLSTSIYFPALNALSKDLNVSNGLINLTLTTYMIFQGLAPTVFGDLADMAGRRLAYILCFVIYAGANIGLALQNNYATLLVLRCFQSTGSSGTVALGTGVISDIASSGERGKYMGFAQLGPMVGPAIAPLLGGILAEFLGWRSIFWFLTIISVVYLVVFVITFPETGRNVVGNGSIPPQGWNMSLLRYLQSRKVDQNPALSRTPSHQARIAAQAELASKRQLRCPNPLKAINIILEKDVAIMLIYCGLLYSAMYTVMSSIPSLFAQIYGFNELQIGEHPLFLEKKKELIPAGLCFIPFGVSGAVGVIAGGYLMDKNYKRTAKRAGITVDIKRGDNMKGFPIELARIQVIWVTLYPGIAAILGFGWALDREVHLAVPLVLLFIIGFSMIVCFSVLNVILIDLYPQSPATATAANNLVRCSMGAAATGLIIQMIDGMGRAWCFTFIAAVVTVTSPMLWAEVKWGPKWREERRARMERRDQDREARKARKGETAAAKI